MIRIKQWIKQIIIGIVCFGIACTFGILSQPVMAQAAEMIDVYVDVEGYNLGQGFYIEPTKVSVPKGSTAEVATRRLLEQTGHSYVATGTESKFYLARINGINNGVVNPPQYITDEVNAEYGESGTLGEFDYTSTSGWMITVNHIKIPVGAGAWEVKDKDVIRWQFTVQGLGADIGIGADALYQHVDKTELIRLLDTKTILAATKHEALSTIINPLATANEVESVVQRIRKHQETEQAIEKAKEEQAKAEAEKKRQEEQARAEAEKKRQEEQARAEAEKKRQEEQAQAEKEKQEEQARQEAERQERLAQLKEILRRKLEEAQSYRANQSTYTPSLWQDFEQAVTKGNEVLRANDTSEDVLENAVKTLIHAEQKLINQTNGAKVGLSLVEKPLARALKQMNETLVKYLQDVGFTLEWDIMTIARGGVDSPQVYAKYYQHAVDYLKRHRDDKTGRLRYGNSSRLDPRSTEMSRAILALAALGQPIENIEGMNLFQSFSDIKHLGFQGINGTIFALIASNTNRYQSENLAQIQDQLVAEILAKQLVDGGWSLSSPTSDPDITAMALQALAPYYRQKDARVMAAVDKAVTVLSEMMLDTGGYASGANHNKENAPSTAQVVTALSELGIDVATDARFNRNGNNPLKALLSYQLADGSFYYTEGQKEKDKFSTEQGTYALVAYSRFVKGENRLYDMTDAKMMDLSQKDNQKDNQQIDPDQSKQPNHGEEQPHNGNGQNNSEAPKPLTPQNPLDNSGNTGQGQMGASSQSSNGSNNQQSNQGANVSNTNGAVANGSRLSTRRVYGQSRGTQVSNGQADNNQVAVSGQTPKNSQEGSKEEVVVSREVVSTVNWWMYIWLAGMVILGVVLAIILKKKNVW